MSLSVRDSTTKLENVSQYATHSGYCSCKICPAKFLKTKFPCNSRRHGKQTFFFAYWVSRLCSELYVCTIPLNHDFRSFDSAFPNLFANAKAAIRGLQNSLENAKPPISVTCGFIKWIFRPYFTPLQSFLSRRPCR